MNLGAAFPHFSSTSLCRYFTLQLITAYYRYSIASSHFRNTPPSIAAKKLPQCNPFCATASPRRGAGAVSHCGLVPVEIDEELRHGRLPFAKLLWHAAEERRRHVPLLRE